MSTSDAQKPAHLRTVHFPAGIHIGEAAKLLIELAPATGTFNDIDLLATGVETPDDIVAVFKQRSEERAALYRASPEGIAAESKRQDAIKSAQAKHDDLVAGLPALDFGNDMAVLDWLCAIQDATDTSGVLVDKNGILIAFARGGFHPGANCGQDFNGENRNNFHRWIVGQALDTLSSVSIHPMIHKFADDWREKFA